MGIRALSTSNAPQPVGPYSQAVWAGRTLYTAGQVGLDPSTGALAPGGFAGQFRQAIANVAAIALAAGTDLSQVSTITVYLTDERDFAAMNALYADLMPGPVFPARTTVVVNKLPLGALVELTAVLVLAD